MRGGSDAMISSLPLLCLFLPTDLIKYVFSSNVHTCMRVPMVSLRASQIYTDIYIKFPFCYFGELVILQQEGSSIM